MQGKIVLLAALLSFASATLIGSDYWTGELVSINTQNGHTQRLPLARPPQFDSHSNPTVDSKNSIYYVVAYVPSQIYLLSYSTKTWGALRNVSLPMFDLDQFPHPHPNVMGLDVHPDTGDVIISGYFNKNERIHGIVKVSLKGEVTIVGQFDGWSDDTDRDTVAVLDSKRNLYTMKLYDGSISYHVTYCLTHKKIIAKEYTVQNGTEFADMSFDTQTGLIYGIGAYENEVSLLKMDAKTLKIEFVKRLNPYQYLTFTDAFDSEKRVLWTYLIRYDSGFRELVQVSLEGDINSHVVVSGGAPFALAFVNDK
jgi:hypothetical protein